jgi:PEP-CTERM motif
MNRRMRSPFVILAAAIFLFVKASVAHGTPITEGMETWYEATGGGLDPVLFSNFGPGHSYDVSAGNPVGDDFFGGVEWQGETFTPAVTARLSTIEIALSNTGGFSDAITVALRSDQANSPGAILEAFIIPSGTVGPLGANHPPITLSSSSTPLLVAGVPYWLTAGAPATSAYAWNFNSTGENANHAISLDGGATWFVGASGFFTPGAFDVDGNIVPEPGTFGLLATGTMIFASRRRIRSKAAQ